MINNWKHIIWVLGLALVMVSCQEQKRKGGSPVRSSFLSPALKKAPVSYNEKAKVVVMYEMPASLKDRPEQILRVEDVLAGEKEMAGLGLNFIKEPLL